MTIYVGSEVDLGIGSMLNGDDWQSFEEKLVFLIVVSKLGCVIYFISDKNF